MKLNEIIMSTCDDNSLGYLFTKAVRNLIQLKKRKEFAKSANSLLRSLDHIQENPNILQTDGYSLVDFLQRIGNPTVDKSTLDMIQSALDSYDDNSGD